ncbi:hypothetical protein SAMN05444274_105203 [Mariniphaga anaerophila]|uniref:Uncharacterized protein n=1 Tax=Mariniphaga anaerophila TaxID=1484053 RepID=A0A1M5BM03_9BACT|nr:hypothetical protein [Mariniphaga anaerophila]SHF43420.1 hypothetical protein SAMN05444274_105203 [Mariniphaga anaerophila]
MQNHQLIIKISAIIRLLSLVAIVLQLISFSTRFIVCFTDYTQVKGLGFLINMFYVGAERNIPTAFSAFILIVASALLFIITALKWKKPKSFYLIWLILSFGFFYLAMDEAMILHETILGQKDGIILGRQFSGFLRHAWIIPFLFTIPFLILLFFKFLMSLDKKTKNLFILSAALFVGGAVGIESVGGYIKDTIGTDNWWYYTEVAIEESFEMAGVILFIYSLLDYLRVNYKTISFPIIK